MEAFSSSVSDAEIVMLSWTGRSDIAVAISWWLEWISSHFQVVLHVNVSKAAIRQHSSSKILARRIETDDIRRPLTLLPAISLVSGL